MADLTLTLLPIKCRHEGCGEQSTVFGFCRLHEREAIEEQFEKFVASGAAPREAPPCFENPQQWSEYVVTFGLANTNNRGGRYSIEFCRDCTPAHKKRMLEEGRCRHPETVFIRSERFNDVIGVSLVNRQQPEAWEKAVMGMSGPVVSLPSSEVVNQVINELAASKRKRGRPRKIQVA